MLAEGGIAFWDVATGKHQGTIDDGTDWVLVTCIGVANPAAPATSSCNKWELTPTGVYNGVSKNVGYLEQVASTSTFIGLYYFTFDVVIAK